MPFLDNFLDKNPIIRLGPPNLGNALNTALNFIINRRMGKDKYFNPEAPDLLHHFIESKTAYPDLVDDGAILGNVLTPLVAGADTTAIAIRAILYFALKEPAVYQRLEKEILAARFSDDKPVPYSAARALPCKLHHSLPRSLFLSFSPTMSQWGDHSSLWYCTSAAADTEMFFRSRGCCSRGHEAAPVHTLPFRTLRASAGP